MSKIKFAVEGEFLKLSSSAVLSSNRWGSRNQETHLKLRRYFHPTRGEEVEIIVEQIVATTSMAKVKRTYRYFSSLLLTPSDAEKVITVIKGKQNATD